MGYDYEEAWVKDKTKWTEMDRDIEELPELGGRVLWVSDGHVGHYRVLHANDAVHYALTDYASTYESDRPETITVDWVLFVDGAEKNNGTHTFEVQ